MGVISHVNEFIDAKNEAMDRALEMMGLKAQGYAQKACPVDTGRLRNSITHRQIDDNTEIIGTNTEYAPYVC